MWAQVNELFNKYFGTRPITPLHNLCPSKPIFKRLVDGWLAKDLVATKWNELALDCKQAWLSSHPWHRIREVTSSQNIGTDWSPIVIDCRWFWLSYNHAQLWVLLMYRSSSTACDQYWIDSFKTGLKT